jgi:hypothetical protein
MSIYRLLSVNGKSLSLSAAKEGREKKSGMLCIMLGSNHFAVTNQPRFVAEKLNAFFRNDSSLNPEKGLKTAGTVEAGII